MPYDLNKMAQEGISRRERALGHQKGTVTTVGVGPPQSNEGSEGDLTVRKVAQGYILYIKIGNIWYDVNSLITESSKILDPKIGIGTTTPISALEIKDGYTTGGAILTLGTKEPTVVANDVLGRINFYAPLETGADATAVAASIAAVAQDAFDASTNSTALYFQTGKSEDATGTTASMVIDEDGNVGMGTTAPSTIQGNAWTDIDLHVRDTGAGATIAIVGATEAKLVLSDEDASSDCGIYAVASAGDKFKIDAWNDNEGFKGTRLLIDESGNVGIGGVTVPGARIHLKQATTDFYGIVIEESGSDAWIRMGHNGTYGSIHTTYSAWAVATPLVFGTHGYQATQLVLATDGRVGIGTTSPGQLLDVNSGGGNIIADGYSTHSLAIYKENIEDVSGYLDKVLACPAQKWNRKPFVSANEIKEAVLEEFGEDVWNEHFPEDNSHRQKALYNMPEGDLKTWIDEWCEAKRVEMRPEDKWQKKRLGLVADAELTVEHLPEVISINDKGEPTGIDTMTYIGILHNAIQELSAKMDTMQAEIDSLK